MIILRQFLGQMGTQMIVSIKNLFRRIFMSKEDRQEHKRMTELNDAFEKLKNRTESDPTLEKIKRKILAD